MARARPLGPMPATTRGSTRGASDTAVVWFITQTAADTMASSRPTRSMAMGRRPRHGRGERIWPDGQHYEGQWEADKMHGHGEESFASGGRYVGQFESGRKQGHGEYIEPDGFRYEGHFEDGMIHWNGEVFTLFPEVLMAILCALVVVLHECATFQREVQIPYAPHLEPLVSNLTAFNMFASFPSLLRFRIGIRALASWVGENGIGSML
mmetsp:Transcript_38015/g.98565  ORF Transcript_38015/g.98565 Transcript_38015/m.98565 type:complete len:209 (-) Transcript_38015:76-702(-)